MRDRIKMKQVAAVAIFLSGVAAHAGFAHAGDWPGWRGPNHNGSTSETNLPEEWSAAQGVLWAAEMPGRSSATPAVWGDKVFVASNDKTRKLLYGICLDRDSGDVLWNKQLVEGAWVNARNDSATCSPVTDGDRVYFMFGTSDLFALDFDGAEVWSKNLDREFGPVTTNWGYGSSPLLYKGRLYIQVLRGQWGSGVSQMEHTDEDSYVLCLDAASGETVWKVHRPSDAIGESFDSYTTPIPYEADGKTAIVVHGGDYITGHDPATGEELWRQAHNPRRGRADRLIPSPVIAGDLVCALQPRGLDAFAFRPGNKARLAYTDSTWIYDERTGDVPTPLYYDGRLYILNGARKMMICLDPATGEEIWTGDLGASARIWSSPTAGDGKIYCLDERGQVTVIAAGDKFKVLSQADMGGAPSKSSIAIADGRLFIRTAEKLYCIGSSNTGG